MTKTFEFEHNLCQNHLFHGVFSSHTATADTHMYINMNPKQEVQLNCRKQERKGSSRATLHRSVALTTAGMFLIGKTAFWILTTPNLFNIHSLSVQNTLLADF